MTFLCRMRLKFTAPYELWGAFIQWNDSHMQAFIDVDIRNVVKNDFLGIRKYTFVFEDVWNGEKTKKIEKFLMEQGIREIEHKITFLHPEDISFPDLVALPIDPELFPTALEKKIISAFPDIKTVGDIMVKTERDFLRARNFGRKSLNQLKEWLAARGAHLGTELPAKVA